MKTNEFKIWEGVYKNWGDAPGDEDVFDGDIWVQKITRRAEEARRDYLAPGSISPAAISHNYVLPVVAGMALGFGNKPLRILDFGGGLAASYFSVVAALPESEKIEFHVVEGKKVCEQARVMFQNEPLLHFHDKLPKLTDPVHIVHSGSALQYIEDWKGLLADLCSYRPCYMVLADVMSGDVETFITLQQFYGKKIRFRFINIEELLSEIKSLGFELLYKSNYAGRICDAVKPLDMELFEDKYQLTYASQLIFYSER